MMKENSRIFRFLKKIGSCISALADKDMLAQKVYVYKNGDDDDHKVKPLEVCVIPDREVVESQKPEITDEHNNFSVVVEEGGSGVKYRVKSENSREILRMHCVSYEYRWGSVDGDFIKPVSDILHMASYRGEYCTKEIDTLFMIRVFMTKRHKYFQQMIDSDGKSTYKLLSCKDVQSYIEKCESDDKDEKMLWKDESGYNRVHIISNGTVINATTKRSEVETESLFSHESVVGYEIIDKDEYYNLIMEY